MARDYIPKDVKITPDARELIIQCVNEFVNLVGSEAQARCVEAKASTIRSAPPPPPLFGTRR